MLCCVRVCQQVQVSCFCRILLLYFFSFSFFPLSRTEIQFYSEDKKKLPAKADNRRTNPGPSHNKSKGYVVEMILCRRILSSSAASTLLFVHDGVVRDHTNTYNTTNERKEKIIRIIFDFIIIKLYRDLYIILYPFALIILISSLSFSLLLSFLFFSSCPIFRIITYLLACYDAACVPLPVPNKIYYIYNII